MQSRKVKENLGITLVALVITIIVLLILAGISIATLYGENGIITKANEASYRTGMEEAKEEISLSILDLVSEHIQKGLPIPTIEEVQEKLLNDGVIVEGILLDEITLEVTSRKEYVLDVIWNGDGTYEIIEVGKEEGKEPRPDLTLNLKEPLEDYRAIIEINAQEGKNGIAKLYCPDGSIVEYIGDKAITKEYEVTKNGTYRFKVESTKGRINSKSITVNNITKALPGEGNINFSPIVWENNKAKITLSTESGLIIQYQVNTTEEDGWNEGVTVTNLDHGDVIFARLYDGTNTGDVVTYNVIDDISPSLAGEITGSSTNSITVSNVSASDEQWGMNENVEYSYYYKTTSDANYTLKETTTNNHMIIDNLTQNTEYNMKITTQDRAGNAGELVLTATTQTVTPGEGSITLESLNWLEGKAVAVLSTTSSLTVQYQVNGSEEVNWNTGTTVNNLNHGDTIYARLYDGVNGGTVVTFPIVDNIAPTITFGTNGNGTYAKSAETTVTITDGQTGVGNNLKYVWTSSSTQPTEGEFTNTFTNNQTITKRDETGSFYLWILANDVAGNTAIVGTNAFALDNTGPIIQNVTTSATEYTITANVTSATDVGVGSIAGYQYSLNNATNWGSTEGASKTFTGLSDNTTYQIYVRAVDTLGNIGQQVGPYEITTLSAYPTLASQVNLGEYVSYSANGYEFGANGKGWRVLTKDASTGVITIISASPVTTVALTGLADWQNPQTKLNQACLAYYNASYAEGNTVPLIRCPGTKADGTQDSGGTKYNDYIPADFTQMQTAGVAAFTDTSIYSYSWLASTFATNSGYRYVRYMNNPGTMNFVNLVNGDGLESTDSNGLRPIITLKTGIQTSGKDGNGVWKLIAK